MKLWIAAMPSGHGSSWRCWRPRWSAAPRRWRDIGRSRPEQVFLSAVTIGELQDGVELTRRPDAAKASEIESWLSTVEMSFAFLPMDTACFRDWSRLMAGRPDSLREDAMIAATAHPRTHSGYSRRKRFQAPGRRHRQSVQIQVIP